jgi:hypothetical protein
MAEFGLLHGDLNARNVAVDINTRHIYIIDFQFTRHVCKENVEFRVPCGDIVRKISSKHQLNELLAPWVDNFYSWAWLVELGRRDPMASRAALLYKHHALPSISGAGDALCPATVYLHCFQMYAKAVLDMHEQYVHYYAHSVFFDQLSYTNLEELMGFIRDMGCVLYTHKHMGTGARAIAAFEALVHTHRCKK